MVPGSEHLSKQYHADLEGIRSKVMQMGGLVEAQARAAIEGFSNGQVHDRRGDRARPTRERL